MDEARVATDSPVTVPENRMMSNVKTIPSSMASEYLFLSNLNLIKMKFVATDTARTSSDSESI